MKKTILLFILVCSLSSNASADQLAYITREQAEKGAAFLKTQNEVLIFCGCCDSDPKVYLKISGVSVRYTGYQDYYQIRLSGVDRKGKSITLDIDLAYTHINVNGKALCAGKLLNFECDPCVADMPWEGDAG